MAMRSVALLVCAVALSVPVRAAEDRLGTAAMQRARELAGAGSAGDDRVVRHLLAAVGARFRTEQRVARHEFEEQGEYCRSKMEHLLWEEQKLDEVVREAKRHELAARRQDVQRTKREISAAKEDDAALEEELGGLEQHRDHEKARNATRHRLRRHEAARAQYALKTVGLLRSLIPRPGEAGTDEAGVAREAGKALNALGVEGASEAAALLEVREDDGAAMDTATRRRALHRSLESLEAELRSKVAHEQRAASGVSATTQDDLRLAGHQGEALAKARRNTERRLRHLRDQLRNQKADLEMVQDTMQQAVTARRATRSRMRLLNSSCELYGSAYETASMYRTRIEELVQESRFMLSHSMKARSLEQFLQKEQGEMGSAEAALQDAVDEQRHAFEALAEERRRVYAVPPPEREDDAEKSMTGASGRSQGHTGVAAAEEEEEKKEEGQQGKQEKRGEGPGPRRKRPSPRRKEQARAEPKMVLKKTGLAAGQASREAYGELVADATGATGVAGAAMRNMTQGAPVVLDAASLEDLTKPEKEETGPAGPSMPTHRHEIEVVAPEHMASVTGATGGNGLRKQAVRVLLRAAVHKALADAAGRQVSKDDALTAIDEEMQRALAEYVGAQQGQGTGPGGSLAYNATSEAGAAHVMTGPYEQYSRVVMRTADTELAKPDVQDLPANEMKAALMVALETALDATPTGATGVWVRSEEPKRKKSGVAHADSDAEGPTEHGPASSRPSADSRRAKRRTVPAAAARRVQPTGPAATAEEADGESHALDEADLERREEEFVQGRATGSTGSAGTGTAGEVMEGLRSMERKMHDAVSMRGSMEETKVLAAHSDAHASEQRQRVQQLKADRKAAAELVRSTRGDVASERQRVQLLRDREQKLRRAQQQLRQRIRGYRKTQEEAEERMAEAEAEAEEAREKASTLRALRRRVAELTGSGAPRDATGAAGATGLAGGSAEATGANRASGATGAAAAAEWAAPRLYHSPGPSEEDLAQQEQRVRSAFGDDSGDRGAGHASSNPALSLLEAGSDSLAEARAEAEALGVTLPHDAEGMLAVLDEETERMEQKAANREAVAADHQEDASAAAKKAATAEKKMPEYEKELKRAVEQLRGAVSSLDETNDELKEDKDGLAQARQRVKAGARAAARMEGAAALHEKHAARLGKLVRAAEAAAGTGATGGATAVAGYASEAAEASAQHRALVSKVVGAYSKATAASATGPAAGSTGPAAPAPTGAAASASGTAGARLWSDHASEVAAELRSAGKQRETAATGSAPTATATAAASPRRSHAPPQATTGPAPEVQRPAMPEMDAAEAQAVRELEAQVRAEARQESSRAASGAKPTSLVRRMEAAIHEEAHAASGATGATGAAGGDSTSDESRPVAAAKREAEQVGQAPSATGSASSSASSSPSNHGSEGLLRFVGHDAREGDMCVQLSGADNPRSSEHSGFLELWEVQAGHEGAQHWLFREDKALCLAEHPAYCLAPQREDGKLSVDYAPLQTGASASPLQDQSGSSRLRLRGTASSSDAAAWTFTAEGRVCLSARPARCLTASARSSNDVSVVLAEASDQREDHQRWLFDTA